MSEASKTPEEQLEQNYAEIGRDFCDQILKWEPDYSWNESPLEYLFQLADQRDEALDRAQRAEHLHYNSMQAVTKVMNEQSSKIAELEKALREALDGWRGHVLATSQQDMPGQCERITELDALASSGQGATEQPKR